MDAQPTAEEGVPPGPAEAEPEPELAEPEPEDLGEPLDRDGSVPGTETAEETIARLRAQLADSNCSRSDWGVTSHTGRGRASSSGKNTSRRNSSYGRANTMRHVCRKRELAGSCKESTR